MINMTIHINYEVWIALKVIFTLFLIAMYCPIVFLFGVPLYLDKPLTISRKVFTAGLFMMIAGFVLINIFVVIFLKLW